MNQEDPSVESALRKLRVAPVPDDLFARLVNAEPKQSGATRFHVRPALAWAVPLFAVAACWLLVLRLSPPVRPEQGHGVARDVPVRQLNHEATLLDERVLVVIQREGRVWEIAEEQWMHRTELVRASPAGEITATVFKREFVCRPVVFD